MAKEKRPTWFKMFLHQKALIDNVPDAAAGKALKAVFAYFANEDLPELGAVEFAVFSAIKPYIDESFDDYERTRERNRKNIEKRWAEGTDTK